jgi:hypothetical protein
MQVAERIDAPQSVAPASETAAFLTMIERAAMNPNVDVEKMLKLMEMRDKFMAQQSRIAFDENFALMQPELPQIDRNGHIIVLSKDDRAAGRTDAKPQQDTPYAKWEDINDAIIPVLSKYGFGLSFRISDDAGKIVVTAILSRAGHRETTPVTLQHDSSGSKNAVQAVGSSIAYGKRYSSGALLNFTSRAKGDADDDGKAAGAPALIDGGQAETIFGLIKRIDKPNADKTFLEYFKIDGVFDLPAKDFDRAVKALEAKVARP